MRVDDADMRDVDEADEGLPEASDDDDIAESSSSEDEDEGAESGDGVEEGVAAAAGLRGGQRQPQPWQAENDSHGGVGVKPERNDVGVSAAMAAAASVASAGGVARLAGRVVGGSGVKGGGGGGEEGAMSMKRVKVEARYDELEAIAAVIAGKAGGEEEPTLLDAVKGKKAGVRHR